MCASCWCKAWRPPLLVVCVGMRLSLLSVVMRTAVVCVASTHVARAFVYVALLLCHLSQWAACVCRGWLWVGCCASGVLQLGRSAMSCCASAPQQQQRLGQVCLPLLAHHALMLFGVGLLYSCHALCLLPCPAVTRCAAAAVATHDSTHQKEPWTAQQADDGVRGGLRITQGAQTSAASMFSALVCAAGVAESESFGAGCHLPWWAMEWFASTHPGGYGWVLYASACALSSTSEPHSLSALSLVGQLWARSIFRRVGRVEFGGVV